MNAQAKPQPKSAPRRSSKPQLQHWTEVQVTDPDTRPLGVFSVKVFIKTDEGSRAQTFKVRAPIGCSSTELQVEAIKTAAMLGFTPVGQGAP